MATKPFKLLSGDVSGTPATYYRATNPNYTRFDIYEVNQWADLDSSAIATHGKYNVQAGTVHIESRTIIDAALKCSGFRYTADGIVNDSGDIIAPYNKVLSLHRVIAECQWTYGAKEVAIDVSGNNLRKLVKQARNAL
jgi:hypothetical protein